jgi:hypothetical protein
MVSPPLKEESDHFGVTTIGGPIQWGATVVAGDCKVCSPLVEKLDHFGMTTVGT